MVSITIKTLWGNSKTRVRFPAPPPRKKGVTKMNLDRLHKHAFRETGGRRSGHTFYQCSLVVGAAELGNDVVVIIPCMHCLRYIKPMVKEQLGEHRVRIKREEFSKIKLENNSEIVFTSRNFQEAQMGYDRRTTAFIRVE